jgi:hypothetical protein
MNKMKFKLRGAQKMQTGGNDLKFEVPDGLEELSKEETKRVVGGESAAYWLGYIAGKIANIFS